MIGIRRADGSVCNVTGHGITYEYRTHDSDTIQTGEWKGASHNMPHAVNQLLADALAKGRIVVRLVGDQIGGKRAPYTTFGPYPDIPERVVKRYW